MQEILNLTHQFIEEQTTKENVKARTSDVSILMPVRKRDYFVSVMIREIWNYKEVVRQHLLERGIYIKEGIQSYEKFMKGDDDKVFSLSGSGQFIWRTHMTYPLEYKVACQARFGQLFVPMDITEISMLLPQKIQPPKSLIPNKCGPPFCKDIQGKAMENLAFMERILCRYSSLTPYGNWYMNRTCLLLGNWFTQIKTDASVQPPLDIDFAWHTYMLFPKEYESETKQFFQIPQALPHFIRKGPQHQREIVHQHEKVPGLFLFHQNLNQLGYVAYKLMLSAILSPPYLFAIIPPLVHLVVEYCEDFEFGKESPPELYCKKVFELLQTHGKKLRGYISVQRFLEVWEIRNISKFYCELGGYFTLPDLLSRVNRMHSNYEFTYNYTKDRIFRDFR